MTVNAYKKIFTSYNIANTILALIFVFIISYVNFLLVKNLFFGEYNQNMASIEISYVQMAKFWVNGGGLWQPLWYLGYPWHVFYTPFLPFLEVLLHSFLGFSFAHSYRVVTALGYIFTPVALFFFVWQIAKSKTGAFLSALFYSLVPSIFVLFVEGIAGDTLSGGFEPRRFAVLVRWGEGPHTVALVFVMLFGLFLSRYSQKYKVRDMLLAGVFFGLTALTNAIALWTALLLLLAYYFAQLCRKETDFIPLTLNYFKLGLLTFGLISFWYNLPFISTFFKEGGGAFSNWAAIFPWGFIIILIVFFLLFWIINKFLGSINGLPFSLFWFIWLFLIVYVYYISGESRIEVVPQALRFNTEVDMALSVLFGVIVSNIYLKAVSIGGKLKYFYSLLGIVVVLVPVFSILFWSTGLIQNLPQYAKALDLIKPGGIENSAEYRMAKKFEELTSGTQERVLAPGNYGFWLNYFVEVPQIRGALYQSSTHKWPDDIYYQVVNGLDAKISLDWFKIANIGKVLYTTASSEEPYKDYKVPSSKFDSVLSIIEEKDGDVYYNVPLKNNSLAKAIDISELKNLGVPKNAIDEAPISQYVGWMEKYSDNRIQVNQVSTSKYKLKGVLEAGQGILFSQTYDSGWYVKNRNWKVQRDALGFLVLETGIPGNFDIELAYRKPLSVYFGYLITLGVLAYLLKGLMKRRSVNP